LPLDLEQEKLDQSSIHGDPDFKYRLKRNFTSTLCDSILASDSMNEGKDRLFVLEETQVFTMITDVQLQVGHILSHSFRSISPAYNGFKFGPDSAMFPSRVVINL
jgi:hypothetical protein